MGGRDVGALTAGVTEVGGRAASARRPYLAPSLRRRHYCKASASSSAMCLARTGAR